MSSNRKIAPTMVFGILLLGFKLFAQSYSQRLPFELVQVPKYSFEPESPPPFIYTLDFAGSEINPTDVAGVREMKFRQIDLVFTLYPKSPALWKIGYDSLLERRFRTLENQIPSAFSDTAVRWRLVVQTACKTLESAKSMFHGFVLYAANDGWDRRPKQDSASEVLHVTRFDTTKLREKFMIVTKIIHGEKAGLDSTAIRILDRHPEWKNALVVVDWTASMYRQGAMVVRWQQEHLAERRIRHFVFFNDGDQKYDAEKVIGETGGIYETPADSLHLMVQAIQAVTLGGEGGDHRENNIEAILSGIVSCPECEQVILIADNSGPVRDLALLPQVDLPVRVLLCGVYKDEIETDYLQIVDQTNGSLHSQDRDITDLSTQMTKGILTIGDKQYARKATGQWAKYEPRF